MTRNEPAVLCRRVTSPATRHRPALMAVVLYTACSGVAVR